MYSTSVFSAGQMTMADLMGAIEKQNPASAELGKLARTVASESRGQNCAIHSLMLDGRSGMQYVEGTIVQYAGWVASVVASGNVNRGRGGGASVV